MRQTLIRYGLLYKTLFIQRVKTLMEYRADFIIGAFSTIMRQSISVFFLWILYQHTSAIKGWSFNEMLFVFAMMTLSTGISQIFFDNFWNLTWYIRLGRFDTILLRPANSLFLFIAERVEPDGFGDTLIGVILIVKASSGIDYHSANVLLYLLIPLFVISGAAIVSSIVMLTSTVNFWFVNGNPFMSAVIHLLEFAKYPATIFNKYIRGIITFIVPLAFVSYYPSVLFLRKKFYAVSVISPLVAAALFCIALFFWKRGIKNYGSTGN